VEIIKKKSLKISPGLSLLAPPVPVSTYCPGTAKGLFLTDNMEEAVLLWDGRVNMHRDELCCASCLWAGRTSRDVPGHTVMQRNGQEKRFL